MSLDLPEEFKACALSLKNLGFDQEEDEEIYC